VSEEKVPSKKALRELTKSKIFVFSRESAFF